MKKVFFIVDCSGSINGINYEKIGQINNLLSDSISLCNELDVLDISVVNYNDNAYIYWDSFVDSSFYEIEIAEFKGRSNLGKAYQLIKNDIENKKIDIKDCVLVLISDGDSSDNYIKYLNDLDSENKAKRIAISLGNCYYTTQLHGNIYHAFVKGIVDRIQFLNELENMLY